MPNSPLHWEVTSNDGTNVVATNSKTKEIFSGTLLEFNKMLSGEKEQYQISADPDAMIISDTVNHVVGTTATLLTRPSGKTLLYLLTDKGAFRYRLGDRTSAGMPTTVDPTVSVTNGSGALKIPDGQAVVLTAAALATVKGYAADSVLTYWWL